MHFFASAPIVASGEQKNRKLTIVMAARHGARNVDPGFGNPMPSHRLE
jgi:hypothetical protein